MLEIILFMSFLEGIFIYNKGFRRNTKTCAIIRRLQLSKINAGVKKYIRRPQIGRKPRRLSFDCHCE